MRFYSKKTEEASEKGTPANSTPTDTPARGNSHVAVNDESEGRIRAIAVILGAVASIGGFMFGYVLSIIGSAVELILTITSVTNQVRFPAF
jgi:SP family sugar:H+ symporter-like MFS transporter